MIRSLFRFNAAACLWIALSQAAPSAQPARDPEQVFQFLDFNTDSFLSKDEFAQLKETVPYFKEHPLSIGFVFWKFDKNHDSRLSVEEFRAFALSKPAVKPQVDKPRVEIPLDVPTPTEDDVAFFEKKVRPVLVDKCYECHSAESKSVKGGLLLDSREGIRKGGDSGPAVVPGSVKESLLLDAVRYENKDLQMPPPKHGGRLPDPVLRDLQHWVERGAVDPRERQSERIAGIDLSKGRAHWAFKPLSRPRVPTPKSHAWPRSDIDRFILEKLESHGLSPTGDSEIQNLARRLSFDLTGLPLSAEILDRCIASPSPEFIESFVDELLSSPAFGERWGRHWLDIARYADSTGRGSNLLYPHAWRYRDYVIASFNEDKPYDQFVREQIAGDLLQSEHATKKNAMLVATGFLALGPKQLNEPDRLQFKLDVVDEQLDTVGQAFLGLTIGCARCHDHKFDAIPQRDYYALAGIFMSTETLYGTVGVLTNAHPSTLHELAANAPTLPAQFSVQQLKSESERIGKQIKNLYGNTSPSSFRLPDDPQKARESITARIRLAQVNQRLKETRQDGTLTPLAMGARDSKHPADMPLYARGEPSKPLAPVKRGFLQVLPESTMQIEESSSGRRELAEWIASPQNPLTARVYVNRVWQHLFGRGIVATPDNFGGSGEAPSHPELLDHLASEFIANGWSVKKLIREIVLSRTYQLSSKIQTAAYAVDPDNELLWRMSPRRLDAEATRDAMLSVSGNLKIQPPLGSVAARVGDGFSGLAAAFESKEAAAGYRSVYLSILRDQTIAALRLFDFANPNAVTGRREETTTPAQALFLLNNPTIEAMAAGWSEKLNRQFQTEDERIAAAYRQAFSRIPVAEELEAARSFLARIRESLKNNPPENQQSTQRGNAVFSELTVFCQALLVSGEFRILN
jgi:hypothetical protein